MGEGFDKDQSLELVIHMYESKAFLNLLSKEIDNVSATELYRRYGGGVANQLY